MYQQILNLTNRKERTHDESRSPYVSIVSKQEQPNVREHKVLRQEVERFKQLEYALFGVGREVPGSVVSLCDSAEQDTHNSCRRGVIDSEFEEDGVSY